MPTDDFPGVRWHGHWVAAELPEFEIDATSVGGDLPSASFSRAQFRRAFDLASVADRVPLRVSADSRYVLWVNGTIVGRGPIRSQPRGLRYDTYDVAAFLRPGQRDRGAGDLLRPGQLVLAARGRQRGDGPAHQQSPAGTNAFEL